MKKSNQLRFPGLFSVALFSLSPSAGHAVSIGELTMKSSLGEPLYAQVDLRLEKGEAIEAKCLSLSKIEDAGGFFPPGLSVAFDQSRHIVEIKTLNQFNEPFATFNLNIKCRGMGAVSRKFILLPELGVASTETSAKSDNENHSAPAANPQDAGSISEQPARLSPLTNQTATESEAITPQHFEIAAPVSGAAPRQSKAAGKRTRHAAPQFRLKLSAVQLDLSHLGKSNDSSNQPATAQQISLDEDEQTAQYLAARNKLEIMQKEMELLKQKLKMAELKYNAALKPAPVIDQSWLFGLMLLGWLTAISLVLYVLYQRFSARYRFGTFHDSIEPNPIKRGTIQMNHDADGDITNEINKDFLHSS